MGFILDRFQKEAIDFIQQGFSVIVSAPTGSGKTRIAEHVIEKCLAENTGAIYTAPIKALSNQKFRDFQGLYGERVGILTGDVSINPNADILIMTTEIYRNSLFEDREGGKTKGKKWVIFDEIHYIDNIERGTVWEESIIFSPPEVRFLCLSATIPNIDQLAGWIKSIRSEEIKTVAEHTRPVPLTHRFQCANRIFDDIRKLSPCYAQYGGRLPRGRQGRGAPRNMSLDLVEYMSRENGLPCIFFAFGRKRCEALAEKVSRKNLLSREERDEISARYDDLLRKMDVQSDGTAKRLEDLVRRGIAFHHAGMLPSLKEVIERLFTSGLIKLIFTTETFALGINMPARSVVFDELRKFYGYAFDFLTTRDFYQMAGRAGRRGMDPIGFVYSRINPHRVPLETVKRIIYGQPEQVSSQFNATYAVLLNLYDQMGEDLLQVYPKSFHYFQTNQKQRGQAIGAIKSKLQLLRHMGYIDAEGLTARGRFASRIYGYELPLSELFMEGFFESATLDEIAAVLSAITYEPRKGYEFIPETPGPILSVRRRTRKLSKRIFRTELRFRVPPASQRFHYHLAESVNAWISGVPFDELPCLGEIDEGETVRNFRMVIQLARELLNTPGCSGSFHDKMAELLRRIKRDEVDAERQLSMGE